jgi:molybdate transport system substrate-binding protein
MPMLDGSIVFAARTEEVSLLPLRSLISFCCVFLATPAGAGDLKVISAGAVRGLIAQIINDYSRQSGQKFDFTIGTTGQLRAIISSGQHADLVITSAPLMGELEKTGNITSGSRADLGRVGLGVVVRDSPSIPDVSTADVFKRAMVDAERIAITDPAVGAVYDPHLNDIYRRLGITDVVAKKAVVEMGGKEVAEAVAGGRADIGVTFISEILPIKGAKLAGPLPSDLQAYVVYATAIPKASADPAAARAFIDALISPAMAGRWTAAGFEAPK